MSSASASRQPGHWLIDLGGGVHAIDTAFHRDRFDAAYLVVDGAHAAFVDTGTNFAVPRLLQALADLGLGPEAVDYVIPTHVHLDHAGGAGLLVSKLPRARLVVHPRGARHMVDPAALYAGALAIYGQDEMDRSYGVPVGVAAERVISTHDGMTLALGGRTLRFADTPGHARHHHCVWDDTTRGWFTGDSFGLSYPEFDTERGAWMLPTSTPVQFEPEALCSTIERLAAASPECVYLTHFGRLDGVAALARQLIDITRRMAALALALRGAPDRHEALKRDIFALMRASAAEHGCRMDDAAMRELLAIDIELNAQGLACWLDRDSRARG